MGGGEARGDLVGRDAEDASEQRGDHVRVGYLRWNRETGIDRSAHRQFVRVAIENVGAFRADFDEVLLLVFGAGEEIRVPKKPEVSQPKKRAPTAQHQHQGHDHQPGQRTAQFHSATWWALAKLLTE